MLGRGRIELEWERREGSNVAEPEGRRTPLVVGVWGVLAVLRGERVLVGVGGLGWIPCWRVGTLTWLDGSPAWLGYGVWWQAFTSALLWFPGVSLSP